MPVCINQSGTWRNATTLCVNDSGTWRNTKEGCINQSGTWRRFLDKRDVICCPLGSSIEGGRLICRASNVAWIVSPNTSEVSRNWYSRNDAVTTAQSVSGYTGWFVPTRTQLQNPGYACRTYWDSYCANFYWSDTEYNAGYALFVAFNNGGSSRFDKASVRCVRAFRCVTY